MAMFHDLYNLETIASDEISVGELMSILETMLADREVDEETVININGGELSLEVKA